MALTPEVIKANTALTGLTEEQLTAIATLSVNDEATVINQKIGEIHGNYEKDIKAITGLDKNQGEKAYDYNKRILTDYHARISGSSKATEALAAAEQKVKDLEEQIKSGKGNEAIAQKLRDAESNLTQLQSKYDLDKKAWDDEKNGYDSKIQNIHVEGHFNAAMSKLKFKAGYPEAVQKTLLDSTKAGILGTYKPDWVDSGDGKTKTMVFRDSTGEIARNKANALNPYTAEELLKEQLREVLDFGRKKEGAGTEDPGRGAETVEVVDIAGAKTQVEADDIITKYLMQKGETRGSASFAEKQKKLREDNGVSKLPIR